MTPVSDPDQRLHDRLLRREASATTDLCARYLVPLIRALRPKFPALGDPTCVDSVVIDALLYLGENPEKYQPDRSSLWNYLYMVARRDLINVVDRERRAGRLLISETDFGDRVSRDFEEEAVIGGSITLDVELLPDTRNISIENAVIAKLCPDGLPDGVSMEDVMVAVDDAFATAEDRAVLELSLDGVRETGPFAVAMGIDHLPIAQQRAEVKRRKDAIAVRLKRIGKRLQRGGSQG